MIILGAVVILGLAVLGLVSTIAFMTGSGLGASSSKPPHAASAASVDRPILRQARAQAARILSHAEQAARARSAAIERAAQLRARNIIQQAQRLAHHVGSAGATAGVTAAPTAAPTSPSAAPTRVVSQGPAPPRLSGIPASWQVVSYNADPAARTADIYNRSAQAFAGTIVLRFYGRRGRLRGLIQGAFSVPAGSTAVVPLPSGSVPARWFRYQLSLTDLRP